MEKWIEAVIWKPVIWLLGLFICGTVIATMLGVPEKASAVVGAVFAAAGGVTMVGLYYRRKLEEA